MRAVPGVARSYARALFGLAHERNQGDAVARELETVVALLVGEPALGELLALPAERDRGGQPVGDHHQ